MREEFCCLRRPSYGLRSCVVWSELKLLWRRDSADRTSICSWVKSREKTSSNFRACSKIWKHLWQIFCKSTSLVFMPNFCAVVKNEMLRWFCELYTNPVAFCTALCIFVFIARNAAHVLVTWDEALWMTSEEVLKHVVIYLRADWLLARLAKETLFMPLFSTVLVLLHACEITFNVWDVLSLACFQAFYTVYIT